METWLDEHPEFFQKYLVRKGKRGMIDAWLVSHAFPPLGTKSVPSANVPSTSVISLDDVDECPNKPLANGSGRGWSGSASLTNDITSASEEFGRDNAGYFLENAQGGDSIQRKNLTRFLEIPF